jgi:hypothetical protein
MTDDPDAMTDAIDRALRSAEVANDAADDMARLSADHRAFADRVTQGQRRLTLLASGAALGAGTALVLGGLVYFRSITDLRDAAGLQAEAAKLMVEQIHKIGEALDKADAQGQATAAGLVSLTSDVKAGFDTIGQAVAAAASDPMAAQMATALRNGVKDDVRAATGEVLTALAEIDLKLGAGGAPVTDLTALLTEVRALAARGGGGTAQTNARTRTSTQGGAAKAAPEPNPFSYP